MDYWKIIGVIAPLLGVFVAIALYWHKRYSVPRQAFYNRLSVLLNHVQWECGNATNDIFKVWHPTITEFLPLYNDVMQFALPFKRRGIRKAWQEYKGEDQRIMKGFAHEIPDSKMFPKSKQEFKHKIDSLLKAL
jgi:hypothetical protein